MPAGEFAGVLQALAGGARIKGGAEYARSVIPDLLSIGLSEDMSGRGMLSAFRAAGLTVGDKVFWGMLADVRAGEANVGRLAGFDLAEVPPEDAFTAWDTNRATGFMYKFEAHFTRTDPLTGDVEPVRKLWNYSTDRPLALGDVMSDVTDAINATYGDLERYGLSFVGLSVYNLYVMNPQS